MNILILKFKTIELIEVPKIIKKGFFKKKEEIVYEKETIENYISLEYNLEEDRFYYTDENKSIPTKKDLTRSVLIFYDIYKRYQKFGLESSFEIVVDRLSKFVDDIMKVNNNETELYLSRLLFGTKPLQYVFFNSVLDELEIEEPDFDKIYYVKYPLIKFR